MPEKVNMLSLQKEFIDSGLLNEDEIDDYNGKNVILNFTNTDIGIRSKFNGRGVYIPPESKINTGGTWICTLEAIKGIYRATPVRQLDASFFMELKRSQKDEILEALWDEHKGELEPHFKDLYLDQMKSNLESSVEEATRNLQSEINKLKEENIDLEERISTSNHICSVGEEMLSNDDAVECDAVQPESALPIAVTVKRISADVIESPYFTHPRYFVHVSHDLKTMVIRPHDYGTVVCLKNKLFLTGLGSISTFAGECVLQSKFDMNKDLLVFLR